MARLRIPPLERLALTTIARQKGKTEEEVLREAIRLYVLDEIVRVESEDDSPKKHEEVQHG